eukprot:583896-Prymnesium_polylepis.1
MRNADAAVVFSCDAEGALTVGLLSPAFLDEHRSGCPTISLDADLQLRPRPDGIATTADAMLALWKLIER